MASASPTAVLAVPERPLVERPEAKAPEAPDGQFAGLMAQFIHLPAKPEPTEPTPEGPTREARGPQGEPSQAKPAQGCESTPAAPSTSHDQKTSAATPNTPASAPPLEEDQSQPATLPGMPEAQAQAQGGLTGIATAASLPSLGNPQGQPVPTPASPMLPPEPVQGSAASGKGFTTPVQPIPSSDKGAPPASTQVPAPAQVAEPGGSSAQPQPFDPRIEIGTRGPAPVERQAQVAYALVQTPSGTAAATAPSAPPEPPQPEQPPALKTEAPHTPTALLFQAVLAEPMAGLREGLVPKPGATAPSNPRTDATPTAGKVGKPVLAPDPLEAQAHPLPQPGSPEAGQPASVETAAVSPSAPPNADTLAARTPPSTVPPAAHVADGSALAAMGSLAKSIETAPVATPAATPAPAATRPSAPILQVEGGVRWMLKSGAQEAQLQLHPESLGQVTIHLKVEGGEVHARLWVTDPASVQAVQDGRPHLEAALKEQGLQLGSFDLQQGHQPFQEAPPAPAIRERPALESAPTRQEAPAAAPAPILNPHHVELYA